MPQHILVLPDGSRITGGAKESPAILSLTLTDCVNPQQELTVGAVCSQMLEVSLYAPQGLSVAAGQQVLLYEKAGEEERLVGQFLLEKPRRTASTWYLTAYDRITLLDQDLTQWFSGLDRWPYTLKELTELVFSRCGLSFLEAEMPNAEYLVHKFSARQVTGRQLIGWAAECAGRFCRATPQGQAEFAWYTPGIPVAAGTDAFFYQGSLVRSDYEVAPITGVQLRREQADVGTCYPQTQTGENTYIVEGNPFLTATDAQRLLPVAQALYEQLSGIRYTPCTFSVPAELNVRPGQILTVQTGGAALQVYVMKRVRSAGKDSISCTGSAKRSAGAARNSFSVQALSGKVLNLQTDVDGIRAENAHADGRAAKLQLDVDSITTQLLQQTQQLETVKSAATAFQQTADRLQLSVESIIRDGVSRVVTRKDYTFDEKGLNISGTAGMENRLDETGMQVTRQGGVLLQATSEGVVAADVKVNNYLIVGSHARLENYAHGLEKRTACFYLEG